MPRHRQSTSMEPAPAPLMEAMELTLVEEDPFDGSEEKTWQLDEPDYGPDGSHAIIQGELDI